MATFRTKQFAAMSISIKIWANMASTDSEQVNLFVDFIVLEFAHDNKLFNERMFRGGCGKHVSQTCIIEVNHVKTNNVEHRKYKGRFI